MNKKQTLQDILREKEAQQEIHNQLIESLDELDLNLSFSKISRWFGTSYLRIKRVFTLLLGMGLFLLSIGLLLFPELMLEESDMVMDMALKLEILQSIRVFAVLLLILSLVLIYISRLTCNMRVRNSRISKAESLTQEIIGNFRDLVALEDAETEALKMLIQEKHDQRPD
jgi:hypothetical protein